MITDMEKGGLRRWSQPRYNEVRAKLEPLLSNHFKTSQVQWIAVCADGTNITQKIESRVCSWYSGPTFVELLESLPIEGHDEEGALRGLIFEQTDSNTYRGKIDIGTLSIGDACVIMPGKLNCQVENIFDGAG